MSLNVSCVLRHLEVFLCLHILTVKLTRGQKEAQLSLHFPDGPLSMLSN